jgi:hypothetical protein
MIGVILSQVRRESPCFPYFAYTAFINLGGLSRVHGSPQKRGECGCFGHPHHLHYSGQNLVSTQ